MNWNDAAVFLQRLFLCAISSAVAGSLLVILSIMLSRTGRWKDSRLRIWWARTALFAFIFPVSIVFLTAERMSFSINGMVWESEFWDVSTSPMQKVYLIVMGIWACGLVCALGFRIRQYLRLRFILKGNVPVEDGAVLEMAAYYRDKYGLGNMSVYRNDLLRNPVCAGGYRKMIILPFTSYHEKELEMIFEHETAHIRNRDLEVKKLALFVTFLHWWNPLSYLLLEQTCLLTEIEADIVTCEKGGFSPKEYAQFLYGLKDEEENMMFVSAISKSEKNMYRRLEGMVRGKSYKKWSALAGCLVLFAVSVIPSYAATGRVVKLNEEWIKETEIEIEDAGTVSRYEEQTVNVIGDGVTEMEDERDQRSSTITLDRTINANTRVLYSWKNFAVGDSIYISAKNSGSESFRIGIRDRAGTLRYISGSGRLTHEFEITVAGDYTAIVENTNSTPITITGTAVYNN